MKTNRKNIFQLLFIKSELHKGRTFKQIRQIYKEQLEEEKGITPEEVKELTDTFYRFYWRYFTKGGNENTKNHLLKMKTKTKRG